MEKIKKILLLLLIVITNIKCDTNDELVITENPNNSCNCFKETWVKYMNGNWYMNGASVYYSNNCEDNGMEVGQPYIGQGWEVKYIVRCE